MEVTLSGLKDVVFAAEQIISEDTHVSGKVIKGGLVICVLPLIDYRLEVDVSGVSVSELATKITTANLTVRSQQLIKAWAVNEGSLGIIKRLGARKIEASEKEPVSKYVDGRLRATWREMFPLERAARAPQTPEEQIASGMAKMDPAAQIALLEKMLAERAVEAGGGR